LKLARPKIFYESSLLSIYKQLAKWTLRQKMNRHEAEIKLKQIFGFDNFFDDQWKTIDRILQRKEFC